MIRPQLVVKITGADIRQTLRTLADKGISAKKIDAEDELTVTITIFYRDFPQLIRICEKRGDMLTVIHRQGVYWNIQSLLKRPVLVFGLVCLLLVTLYVPSRIFFLRVEGNNTVPTRLIMDRAEACGIRFGASRRAVRSVRMKNSLLEAVPELQWAGVNTKGCVAIISVRERSVQELGAETTEFGHIVALTDALVTDCTATRGNLLCAPGQAVAAGEILISGYTDTGLCIRAEQAEGEIYGQTIRNCEAVMPLMRCAVTGSGLETKKISFLIGKKRINLWKDSGIWDTTCDRMYEEYYITLPGGFQLPVGLAVERYNCRSLSSVQIPQEEAEEVLSAFLERYMSQQMLAGSILDSETYFQPQSGLLRMTGEYHCQEMIGILQRFQIGEENGENN